ncbi:hypothetical protein GCM10027597_11590 [Saccharopolyspora tripterygii]
MVGIANDSEDLIAPFGEQPTEGSGDLPVGSCDDDAHVPTVCPEALLNRSSAACGQLPIPVDNTPVDRVVDNSARARF